MCFCGSAIMWFSNELTSNEKKKLRHSIHIDLNDWYIVLTKCFKMRRDVVVAHLVYTRFTYIDL